MNLVNQLAGNPSLYLRQHATNPVAWQLWNTESLALAQTLNRPIFLSVGYSACHWCHVMEHESFEDQTVADILNQFYIPIKVDREIRPDVDRLYMKALMAFSGHGGWPMSVWLTPDLVPFYAGTYFPLEEKHGLPAFPRVLEYIAEKWQADQASLVEASEEFREVLESSATMPESDFHEANLDYVANYALERFDEEHGGFGEAPKFPQSPWMLAALRVIRSSENKDFSKSIYDTLKFIGLRGLHDHVGGGFHRYSVDRYWVVPHFEKMLYDNAPLARAFLQAGLLFKEPWFTFLGTRTLEYCVRELLLDEGRSGIATAQDADASGVEGQFFVWKRQQIRDVLGEEADAFFRYFVVTDKGNFEGGTTILTLADIPHEDEVKQLEYWLEKLYKARSQRVHPATDKKVLASLTAEAGLALLVGYAVTGQESWYKIALNLGEFILKVIDRAGFLPHELSEGKREGYADDYGLVSLFMLELYLLSGCESYQNTGRELLEKGLEKFWDDEDSSFSLAIASDDGVPVKLKDYEDNATVSGNSAMFFALSAWCAIPSEGFSEWGKIKERAQDKLQGLAYRFPLSFGRALEACVATELPVIKVQLEGRFNQEWVTALYRLRIQAPELIWTFGEAETQEAIICDHSSCSRPLTELNQVLEILKGKLGFVDK